MRPGRQELKRFRNAVTVVMVVTVYPDLALSARGRRLRHGWRCDGRDACDGVSRPTAKRENEGALLFSHVPPPSTLGLLLPLPNRALIAKLGRTLCKRVIQIEVAGAKPARL